MILNNDKILKIKEENSINNSFKNFKEFYLLYENYNLPDAVLEVHKTEIYQSFKLEENKEFIDKFVNKSIK